MLLTPIGVVHFVVGSFRDSFLFFIFLLLFHSNHGDGHAEFITYVSAEGFPFFGFI